MGQKTTLDQIQHKRMDKPQIIREKINVETISVGIGRPTANSVEMGIENLLKNVTMGILRIKMDAAIDVKYKCTGRALLVWNQHTAITNDDLHIYDDKNVILSIMGE